MTRVAFLGLGRMGAPMATNVARAGHELTVWNRTRAKSEDFAVQTGARCAPSVAEAVRGAEVVISMVADDAALFDIYRAADGVLAGISPGAVAIDMSTVSPRTVAELATELRGHGVHLHDAPVSGSVATAAAGSLTIMVGGGELAPAARAVLEAIGQTVVPLGPSGAGSAMKLAVNAVVHALNGAVSEALVLAERAGIERALAYQVLENSAVAAPFVKYRRSAFLDPEGTPVAFLLPLAAKDLRLAVELADQVGAHLPQTRTNLQVLESAVAAGYRECDESGLAQRLRALAQETNKEVSS